MIVCALQRQKLVFDYALTSEVALLPNRVRMSYEARIALIEGDEHVTSALEKRFQLEFYRPHIAILTNLSWTPDTDHATPDAYYDTFRSFTKLIEREGKLIYFEGDRMVKQLAENVREDITAIPYGEHAVIKMPIFIGRYPNIVYLCSYDYSKTEKKRKYSRVFVIHVAGGRPDTCQSF